MASLQSLSSAVLDTAKSMARIRYFLHLFTFLLVSTSIFYNGSLLYACGILALLSEVSCWFISLSSARKKSLGQEILRLNILQQAYGAGMNIDTAYLKTRVSASEYTKSNKFENTEYYSSNHENPGDRLKNILQESCFWSQHLYSACWDRAVKIGVALSVVILVLIIIGLSTIDIDSNYSYPRFALLLLTFFPLWEQIGKAISFSSAASRLSLIDHRMEAGIDGEASLLAIFADYNVVTSNTPLIPQNVYEKEQDKLNQLWDERSA
jgi:hypothetical protein